MALITSQSAKRHEIPHEAGDWMDLRPIRAGDLEGMAIADGNQVKVSIDLAAQLIAAWSYPEPVTRENVAMLDIDTFVWLDKTLQAISGIRSPAEQENLGDSSLLTSGQEPADSRLSSISF